MIAKDLEQAYAGAIEAVRFIPEGPYRVAAFQVVFDQMTQITAMVEAHAISDAVPESNGHAKARRSETQNRILAMKGDGYFDNPRLPSEVRSELQTRGFHHNPSDVRMALLRLAQSKELRRLREGEREFRYAKP